MSKWRSKTPKLETREKSDEEEAGRDAIDATVPYLRTLPANEMRHEPVLHDMAGALPE
jgi:hypothetical protein